MRAQLLWVIVLAACQPAAQDRSPAKRDARTAFIADAGRGWIRVACRFEVVSGNRLRLEFENTSDKTQAFLLGTGSPPYLLHALSERPVIQALFVCPLEHVHDDFHARTITLRPGESTELFLDWRIHPDMEELVGNGAIDSTYKTVRWRDPRMFPGWLGGLSPRPTHQLKVVPLFAVQDENVRVSFNAPGSDSTYRQSDVETSVRARTTVHRYSIWSGGTGNEATPAEVEGGFETSLTRSAPGNYDGRVQINHWHAASYTLRVFADRAAARAAIVAAIPELSVWEFAMLLAQVTETPDETVEMELLRARWPETEAERDEVAYLFYHVYVWLRRTPSTAVREEARRRSRAAAGDKSGLLRRVLEELD